MVKAEDLVILENRLRNDFSNALSNLLEKIRAEITSQIKEHHEKDVSPCLKEANTAIVKYLEATTRLQAAIVKLSNENEENKKKTANSFEEMSNKILDNGPKLMSSLFKLNNKPNMPAVNLITAVKVEEDEIKKKQNNIVLFGVKQSTSKEAAAKTSDDAVEVKKIFEIIKIDYNLNVAKIHRIRPSRSENSTANNSDKPTPIIVELKKKETVLEVLKASKNLRSAEGYDNVYINPDLTPTQREFNKRLVQLKIAKNKELKENGEDGRHFYGIRNNEVVKLAKKNDDTQH